jgi:archaetidylinositol phosphate synthase
MSENTWIHRVVRPMVRPLVNTPITPNHLTTLRLITAVIACVLIATGRRDYAILGALVFIASFLLDRADGELARASGKFTALGKWLDPLSDCLANILFFFGIGVALQNGPLGSMAIVLGLIAGIAIAAIFGVTKQVERTAGPDAAAFPNVAGFDPDDAMIVVPIAVLVGAELPILIAASFGAPAFLLWTYWRARRHLAAPYPERAARRDSASQ